jgi:hypothetical protein
MENSSFGRLFGVLFSPGKTFQSIAIPCTSRSWPMER